jgi:glycosyltransferase involved in cell wall biosynthesis
MTSLVTVDLAGVQMGGAARYAGELRRYLHRTGRDDVRLIGTTHRVGPAWLLQREILGPRSRRRIALNNVSFVAPGSERWALLRNALHFLTETEESSLEPSLLASVRPQAAVVRLAARRADAIVVPSTAMAERVLRFLPTVKKRLIVRPHPVSPDSVPQRPRDPAILCPVLFAPYKQMDRRLAELLNAVQRHGDPSVRVRITADPAELPPSIAADPRIEVIGRPSFHDLREIWARSRAIYFPSGIESFGYPLAEARTSGHPVIARDTTQNREIAGSALCGFQSDDLDSLHSAVKQALSNHILPDPALFDPGRYFDWIFSA